jgi:opacity protein-like surface antigen
MKKPVSVFLLFVLFTVESVFGGSILSTKGIGTPMGYPGARSLGMGGLSIALSDSITMSLINPASLYRINGTLLSLQYHFENNRYKDPFGSASSSYSNVDGFGFTVPLGSGLGIGLSLAPQTRMDYKLAFDDSLNGESYTKSITGTGGLNTFALSLSWSPFRKLGLGISGQYWFGKLKEQWQVVYDNKDFISSSDIFSTKNNGWSFTIGLIAVPLPQWSIGLVYRPSITLSNTTDTYYVFEGTVTSESGKIGIPGFLGAGTSFEIPQLAVFGVEWMKYQWNRFSINGVHPPEIAANQRISTGVEFLGHRIPNEPLYKRIAYRLGFSYQPYFSKDPNGNTIHEWWTSIGFGIPMSNRSYPIDVAFLYGQRGSLETNGLHENLFRIHMSITVGEKWFVRRY